MSDREEREEHIKRLEAALACEEKQFSGKCSKAECDDNCALLYKQGNWGEWKDTLRYAIDSLKTDLKYDLLYEETSEQADKQADKPTTKNDLGVDCISRQTVLDLIADYDLSMGQVVRSIHALPPVTPIRPKGHWIETAEEYYKAINEKGGGVNEDTDYFVDDIACSECLAKFSVIDNEAERFDFCPCCGSDNR